MPERAPKPTPPPIEVSPVVPPSVPESPADIELVQPSGPEVDLKIPPELPELPELPRPVSPIDGLEENRIHGVPDTENITPATEVVEPAPEPVPVAPEASIEAKSFEEVLKLQDEAYTARKEMMNFRHGKKVADLSPEDQERYKELKKISQDKRAVWLAELDKLPEDQQAELKSLKRFDQVKARLEELPAEKIVPEALKEALIEATKELEALDAEIAKFEKLVKFDKEIQPNTPSLYADRNIADLKELKARRRALLAKKKELEEPSEPIIPTNPPNRPPPVEPPPTPVPPVEPPPIVQPPVEPPPVVEPPVTPPNNPPPVEPPPSVVSPETPPAPPETPEGEEGGEPDEPPSNEQLQAEAKARRREFLRAAINRIDKKILEKVDESSKTKTWDVWGRMRINQEIRNLRADHARLDREMNERVGFGTKFKEMAAKAYRAVKNKLKFERSRPIGIGNLRGGPEPVPPIGESTGPEMENETGEPLDTKGSWWKFTKQRLGGAVLGGIPEYLTAEKMRKGTKAVGQETSALANSIEAERNLSLGEAEDEAIRIKQEMKAKGIESVMDDRILGISAEITAEKVAENDARIDQIVIMEINKLEKNLKGYKKDFGEDILTEENKSKIATEMRARLVEVRKGQAGVDVRDLTKMLRGNLDENWKDRYLYGAIETVLAGLLIKWVFFSGVKEVAIAKGAGVASKETATALLKDTIWAESKRQLVAHGVANPTNGQILQVATKFCVDSGVKVMANGQIIWAKTAGGAAIDTLLAKGFMIKMAGGLKIIAGMVAGA